MTKYKSDIIAKKAHVLSWAAPFQSLLAERQQSAAWKRFLTRTQPCWHPEMCSLQNCEK